MIAVSMSEAAERALRWLTVSKIAQLSRRILPRFLDGSCSPALRRALM
jgi:hypothetical protein